MKNKNKNKNKNNDLIYKFLSNELTPEELELFKLEWKQNPKFVKEVQTYSHLVIALKTVDKSNSSQKRNFLKVFFLPKKVVRYFSAAAIVALIILAIPSYFLIKGPSAKHLAQQNFIDYRLYPLRSSHKTSEKSKLNQVLQAYNNQQIPEAISLMKEIEDKRNDIYWFTLGDLFLTANQPDSAIYYYTKGTRYNSIDPYTQWNIAMSWLHKNEIRKAKKMLHQMVLAKQEPYASRAQSLLTILNTPSFRFKAFFY